MWLVFTLSIYTFSGFSLFWMKDILVIPPFDLVNIFCLNSCVSKHAQSKSISTWVNSFFTKTNPYFLKTRTEICTGCQKRGLFVQWTIKSIVNNDSVELFRNKILNNFLQMFALPTKIESHSHPLAPIKEL